MLAPFSCLRISILLAKNILWDRNKVRANGAYEGLSISSAQAVENWGRKLNRNYL